DGIRDRNVTGVQTCALPILDGRDLSYGDVQRLSYRIARGLERSGIAPGEKVAILSGNDPLAFACVFGISRAAAVWCPINPRNERSEERRVGQKCRSGSARTS